MQLSHMAPPRLQHPHEFSPANGSAHNQIAGPFREARRTETPPRASPINVVRPQASVAVAHSTIRSPVRTHPVPPPRLGRSNDRNATNGTINDPYARGATSNTLPDFTPDPTSAWPGDTETTDSSGDDNEILRSSRPFPVPGRGSATLRAQVGPPTRGRPTQPVGSYHLQRQDPRRQSVHSFSSESGSNSYSEGSTNQSNGAERRRLWAAMSAQRLKIRQIREYLSGKRRDGRALRNEKDRADNALMQIFRPQLTSSRPMAVVAVDVIKKKFEDMQQVRDDYYAVESEYERIEVELTYEEFKLQELEDELYRFLEDVAHANLETDAATESGESEGSSGSENYSNDASDDDSGDDLASRYSLLGISADLQQDIHPLYYELLDAAGDRGLAKEHHDELLVQRDRILYDIKMKLHRERVRTDPGNLISEEELESLKSSLSHIPTDPMEFKAKFGVEIEKDDLDFLRDYKRDEESVRRNLEATSRKVEHLAALCREKGVMRKNAPYNEEYAIYADSDWASFSPEGNVAIEPPEGIPADLSHPVYPTLLSNPSHVLDLLTPQAALARAMKGPKDDPAVAQRRADCMKEYGIENLMKNADSKPDYINQWLIHRLRTTPMEVELMFSIFESSFKIRNLRRWQEDVLYYWRQDAAASLLPQDFSGPMTAQDDLQSNSSIDGVNSAVLASVRAKSENDRHTQQEQHHRHYRHHHHRRGTGSRTINSSP